jgi:hypothetical protein
MKLLIKILGQTKQFPALRVDFGPGYTFPWNESLKAYTYEAKSQKEIDDIFQSQSVHAVWTFAPVIIKDAAPTDKAAPAPEPIPAAPPTPEAEAEIARLQGLLRAAESTIARRNSEAKDKDGTIEMLRADLRAQQEKAAKPAKKPATKGKSAAPEPDASADDTDIPTE